MSMVLSFPRNPRMAKASGARAVLCPRTRDQVWEELGNLTVSGINDAAERARLYAELDAIDNFERRTQR